MGHRRRRRAHHPGHSPGRPVAPSHRPGQRSLRRSGNSARTHAIESEDSVSAILRYASGATGVIQASTSIWPGYPERIEIHGTKGTAIITGDQLTTWDVQEDSGEPAPIAQNAASGASDPMAISLAPFERQFLDFGEACREGRAPACSGVDGYRALQLVRSIYTSCAEGKKGRLVGRKSRNRTTDLRYDTNLCHLSAGRRSGRSRRTCGCFCHPAAMH